MAQIYDVLKDEHREIERMLDQLTIGKADGEMFAQLYSALEAHQQAEEKTIYQDLVKPEETHDIALEGIEEHHVSDLLLKELLKLQPGDERFHAKLVVLNENVRHHIHQEERHLFKQAKKVEDRQWAETTAERYEQQEDKLKQRMTAQAKSQAKTKAKTKG